MNKIQMTPLELGILLHYYTRGCPFEPVSELADDITDGYCKREMMEVDDSMSSGYTVTAMGRAWIKHLLSIPLPTKAAVIYSDDGTPTTIWVEDGEMK